MSAPNKFYDVPDRQLEPGSGRVPAYYPAQIPCLEVGMHVSRTCRGCGRIVRYIYGESSACPNCEAEK
jgi:hypothetical protein